MNKRKSGLKISNKISKPRLKVDEYPEPDVLIAILKFVEDLEILFKRGWYRIPVKTAPPHLHKFLYLAFYQPRCFGEHKWRIRYYGKISDISITKRKDLLPRQPDHPRAEQDYYKIRLADLREKHPPLISFRGRRIVFIPTTIEKLLKAEEINHCFHNSPLEDKLWEKLKQQDIRAERNIFVNSYQPHRKLQLDMVVPCKRGIIDLECDGDSYHLNPKSAVKDNARDNWLTSRGWKILRFSSEQINEKIQSTLYTISQTVDYCGGEKNGTVNWNDQLH
ncbi:MAG: endonuclease domain-containing protein [bacterium]